MVEGGSCGGTKRGQCLLSNDHAVAATHLRNFLRPFPNDFFPCLYLTPSRVRWFVVAIGTSSDAGKYYWHDAHSKQLLTWHDRRLKRRRGCRLAPRSAIC